LIIRISNFCTLDSLELNLKVLWLYLTKGMSETGNHTVRDTYHTSKTGFLRTPEKLADSDFNGDFVDTTNKSISH